MGVRSRLGRGSSGLYCKGSRGGIFQLMGGNEVVFVFFVIFCHFFPVVSPLSFPARSLRVKSHDYLFNS